MVKIVNTEHASEIDRLGSASIAFASDAVARDPQYVGGVMALMISAGASLALRNWCGVWLSK